MFAVIINKMAYGSGMRSNPKPTTTARKMPAKKASGTISEADRKRLAEHKVHHTAKHMTIMRRELRAGKTFGQAHKIAMKDHGK
jgi:hypothetical protein